MAWERGNIQPTFAEGLTARRTPRRRRIQYTVALAAVGAKVLGGTAEAILAAAGVQRTSLARGTGVLAALGDSTAIRAAASTAIRTPITAIATSSTAGPVGAGLTRTTGVVVPPRQLGDVCRGKRHVIAQHGISPDEGHGPSRAISLPIVVEQEQHSNAEQCSHSVWNCSGFSGDYHDALGDRKLAQGHLLLNTKGVDRFFHQGINKN